MAVEVLFPKVDMDADTGRISRWLVKDGASVKEGDVLFEIESEKAAIEVDAPSSGILALSAADPDGVIKVGQAVARICSKEEYARTTPEISGTSIAQKQQSAPAALTAAPTAVEAAVPARRGLFSTPLARRLASESGIDLATITGTGPRGRIQKKDILAAAPGDGTHQPDRGPIVIPVSGGPLNSAWIKQGGSGTAVLLHGFGSDLNIWRAMLGGASLDGNVLAIDLPGHGQSPRTIPADLDQLAEQVERTLAAANIGRVVLGGHSFGGAIAARVASRGVVDVRSLLMFAPAGLGPEINGSFLRGFLEAKSRASIVPWLNELVFDSDVISPSFIGTVERQAADAGLRTSQRLVQERFFPDGTQALSILPDLAGLTIPARIVVGTEDRILPAAYVQRLSGGVSINTFRACGHMPQIERRSESIRILNEMLCHAR